MTPLRRLNRWFDRLPEPHRFIIFAGCVGLPLITLQTFNPPVAIVACAAFIAVRTWWLGPGHKHRSVREAATTPTPTRPSASGRDEGERA